jgi:phosphoglucosamine mutase
VLLRYSGTEPLARVMVEGEDADRVSAGAERIAEAIRRTLG